MLYRKCIIAAFAISGIMSAGLRAENTQIDTLAESVVAAAPKDMVPLRKMSFSSSSFYSGILAETGLKGVKDLSALAPGLFIPEYGSRLTTSVYIRGIGSRTGESPVSMYIDGIPVSDKSAFDFLLTDVERIDVLRGPQSTLYGQNTMGGLIRVFTKDPRHCDGTDIRLGAATYGDFDAGVTHYHHFGDKVSAMAGLSYSRKGGFYTNAARGGERVDDGNDLAARFRIVATPSEATSMDLNVRYSFTDQGGYPYCQGGGPVSYNRRSSYRRHLLDAGLNLQHTMAGGRVLGSVTGLQMLDDEMNMDQDFSAADIYSLIQRQKTGTLSQEFTVKHSGSHWNRVTGLFLHGCLADTDGPVTFHKDGTAWLGNMVSTMAGKYLPTIQSGPMTMNFVLRDKILDPDLAFNGVYKTPKAGAALFHQSDYNGLFGVEGLGGTLGLRLDVQRRWLEYGNNYSFSHVYSLSGDLSMPAGGREIPMVPEQTFDVSRHFEGNMQDTDFEIVPKFALQYELPTAGSVYASVSRGYRSGGYNIQMFSEFLQADMQNAIKADIAGATIPVVESVGMIPADAKENILEVLGEMSRPQEQDVAGMVRYAPEHAWNYELGSHLRLFGGRLYADLATFWIETSDLQLSQMAPSGLGRVTVNAGSSRSVGVEADLRTSITDALSLNAAYGYTYARFRDGRDAYVPFTPANTLSVNARYAWECCGFLDRIVLTGGWHGAGRIYWDDANEMWQDFYGTADARLMFERGGYSLTLWGFNLFNDRSQAFCFTSMGSTFHQKINPFQGGIEIAVHF